VVQGGRVAIKVGVDHSALRIVVQDLLMAAREKVEVDRLISMYVVKGGRGAMEADTITVVRRYFSGTVRRILVP
jgi:hypothetical protein